MVTGYLYNDLGFGDINGVLRNLTNALGFITFDAGALEVALNRPLHITSKPRTSDDPAVEIWLLLLLLVIFTTGHTQDMPDQKGDAERNRSSIPLQFGDSPARWITIAFMTLWGLACPLYWRTGWLGYILCSPLAFIIAYRSRRFQDVESDKMTFKLWNLWMMCLYCLPVARAIRSYV